MLLPLSVTHANKKKAVVGEMHVIERDQIAAVFCGSKTGLEE
jgi:hypothetical protein